MSAGRYGQGRGGRPWRRKVEQVKQRDQYTCCKCGRLTEDGEADHIVPLAKGGSDDLSNLQWLCREPCHAEKTRLEMGMKPKVGSDVDGWPRS
jgi:5-methylcytosine-specific restriction protein A